MSAGLIRNGLIFVGIVAGIALCVVQIVSSASEEAAEDTEQVAKDPVMLNTAKPPDIGETPLSRPLSLESGFGRTELTGLQVSTVPENPLDELDIDRRWDVTLSLRPPKPPADLPPAQADDEVVRIDDPEEGSTTERWRFENMPAEARDRAEAALVSLKDGTEELKQGMAKFRKPGQVGREGNAQIRDAAKLLRDARDKLSSALQLAPQHPELLRLMQEAKANLYICLKHGIY